METTVLNKEWLIASEVELIYKSKVKVSQRPQITSSYYAYKASPICLVIKNTINKSG